MNNANLPTDFLSEEETFDRKPLLRQRELELAEMIEALQNISQSKYWKVLLERIFNKDLAHLQQGLEIEKNPTEIYRLQGEIKRSKTLDLPKKLQAYEVELQNVRKLLNAD